MDKSKKGRMGRGVEFKRECRDMYERKNGVWRLTDV